ncbi:hypothetical protein [Lachnospira multipara]|uniref:hypothetical protein n=1 Tax=Lachnospira multipara TaxID=28051 RepID=UPI0004E221D0|nr:hypothetical protein [Lachnospira multipara]
MIIDERVSDYERIEVEKLLLLEDMIPFCTRKTRKFIKRVIYILTPILFLLSFLLSLLLCFYKDYSMAILGFVACLYIFIIQILYKVRVEKKEKNIHNFAWNNLSYSKIEVTDDAVMGDGVSVIDFKIIEMVIKYHNIFFFLTDRDIIGAVKIGEKQALEFIDILNKKNILFEEKNEPFNFNKYLKKKK